MGELTLTENSSAEVRGIMKNVLDNNKMISASHVMTHLTDVALSFLPGGGPSYNNPPEEAMWHKKSTVIVTNGYEL